MKTPGFLNKFTFSSRRIEGFRYDGLVTIILRISSRLLRFTTFVLCRCLTSPSDRALHNISFVFAARCWAPTSDVLEKYSLVPRCSKWPFRFTLSTDGNLYCIICNHLTFSPITFFQSLFIEKVHSSLHFCSVIMSSFI